jgi:glycosyltransferase involved in cell wall biosynthesis
VAIVPHARPRILHVGPRSSAGGIGVYLLGLLASPLARHWDLRVLDVRVPEASRRHRSLRLLLSARFGLGMLWRLGCDRPVLVHLHTSDYGGFWEKSALAILARLGGRPFLLHLHGGSFDLFLQQLSQPQARLASSVLRRAARVIVLSEAWRPLLERFAPGERVVVVPNAIHCADYNARASRRSGSPLRLLFIGMLSQRKGLDELMEALLELRRRGVGGFEVDIVGHEELPGEWERYRRLFRQAGLEAQVHFHGPAYGEAKLRFLQGADVFVLPSRSESFGLANLEAMAAGLPVVSTRTGAVPEYLTDGVHGLLVEPGDAGGLADALQALLADAALRQRLGAAARVRAGDFDWNVVGARLDTLYREVLSEAAAARG